jgi:hypothetical protein
MDMPYTGHSAEHQPLVTNVLTYVPTGRDSVRMTISTDVTDGKPTTASLYEARQGRIAITLDSLPVLTEHIIEHRKMVKAVIVKHTAALAALGEGWALDTSAGPEHVEQGE